MERNSYLLDLALVLWALVGVVSCQGDCTETMKCMGPDFNTILNSNDKPSLCKALPEVLKCMREKSRYCEGAIKASFDRNIDTLQKKEKQFCPTSCSPQQMEQCYTVDLQQAKEEKDTDRLCQLYPGVLNCVEEVMNSCGDRVPAQMKQYVTKLRDDAKCSPNTGPSDSGHVITALTLPFVLLLSATLILLA
ncbi:uncharacterized protein LOC101845227 [Aplysia californica]|uniref:Uncharacterized protein LOC101845227 n=1 Tax=Aplysia californica TaxID=6500 RepID=A0ABM0ZVF2_APLCA|nr:uncharacterized protein LOC101845227 [Aplysia californica]